MSTDQEYWDACLIKTWRNDGNLLDACVMFKSITGKLVFDREDRLLRTPSEKVPLKINMRPFVAQYLEKISRRLWDQPPEKDVLLLKKLKDSKYDTTTQNTNPDREMINARSQYISNRKKIGMNTLATSNRNQATDWGITKGTGRTARTRRK